MDCGFRRRFRRFQILWLTSLNMKDLSKKLSALATLLEFYAARSRCERESGPETCMYKAFGLTLT